MVLDMVEIVGMPSMAKERIGNVGEEIVNHIVRCPPGKYSAHVDILVLHQRVRAHVPRLHDPVQKAM